MHNHICKCVSVSGCGTVSMLSISMCMHVLMFMRAGSCVCVCLWLCMCVCVCACPLMRISPGMLVASRDEEVLEVKAGDPALQQRLLLHGGGDASSSRPSQAHTIAKTKAEASAGLGAEAGLEVGRMVMGRGSTVKSKFILLSFVLCLIPYVKVFLC